MSRKHIAIIIAAVVITAVLVGGNALWYSYYKNIDASSVPVTPIKIADQDVAPMSADITIPLLVEIQKRFPAVSEKLKVNFGYFFEKQLDCMLSSEGTWWVIPEGMVFDMQDPATYLGLLGEAPYAVEFDLPDVMYWDVSLKYIDDFGEETPVYMEGGVQQGTPPGFSDTVVLRKAGEYAFEAVGTLYKNAPDMPSGTIRYRAYFSVKNPDPLFTPGRTELAQGDILSIKLENIPEGIVPEIDTALGPAVFTNGVPREDKAEDPDKLAGIEPEGFSSWYAAVPISNSRATGDYPVTVRAGEVVYETTVTVIKYEFDFQNLIIDTSIPSVASAVSGQAITEFREKFVPLLPIFSEERYWDGLFVWPIKMGPEDFISTQFGETRITNGDQSTRRSHMGMDIAASTGTPVYASGAGKVMLAEFLLNTGNTVVIDHGGGLKSIYYHMNSVETTVGKIVEQDELIGTVGSTGYSTGPHLHFEIRIGEQPVSPSMLFEPIAGLYSAK